MIFSRSTTRKICAMTCAIAAGLLTVPQVSLAQEDPLTAFQKTVAFAKEEEAYGIALEAYLYGYPRVEMARRIYNETRRVSDNQVIFAPLNSFYYFSRLARPGDGLVIKAPNNDTLYGSAYLDLSKEPVVLRIPPMGGRYYVALVADAAGGVGTRINSRTIGPGPVDLMFVGPNWKGDAPKDVRIVRQAINNLWLLMRVASEGGKDELVAAHILQRFVLAPLSLRQTMPEYGQNVPISDQPLESRLTPMGTLEFFRVLASMLEKNPLPPEDAVLASRWQRIGLENGKFNIDALSPAVRRGLEKAVANGERIVMAAQFGVANNINGWNYSDKIGRIRNDWSLNAAIAHGGYGNVVEDSVYHQRNLDSQGKALTGRNQYRMTFLPGKLPPVRAFWSITAYDSTTFDLIENPVRRYSFGDRTQGYKLNADGSLTISIQRDPPADPILRANWLPVSDKPFYLIMRTYDPASEIATGAWAPPSIITLHK